MKHLISATFAAFTLAISTAHADPLSAVKGFTLNDVKVAEAVYAANPTVPTAKAATQCLGFLDATLSASGAPVTVGFAAPVGVASAIADLDVALSTANAGLPPLVDAFNQNCGWYIEDLKAAAAAHAAGGVFGFLHL